MDKHLSTHFDMDLTVLLEKLMYMGTSVELQLKRTLVAFSESNESLLDEIFATERNIDALEIAIDEGCSQVIVMRQPVARDLRFVLAVSKAVAILERAADEIVRIANRVNHLKNNQSIKEIDKTNILLLGDMSGKILQHALEAFAQMNAKVAAEVMQEDEAINLQFYELRDSFMTTMKQNPDTITTYLDLLVIVKALERIGDYAKKIAEFIIYVAKGTDVRHGMTGNQ